VTRALRNPYEVLGVETDASADAIKAAYRRLALQYHPDRNPGDKAAEERFKEISEAYATLRDPESRARFDRFGSTRPEASRPDFSTVDWQTIFQEADIKIDWDARGGAVPRTGNLVFDMLFGMMAGVMRQSGLLPGEDRHIELEIPLEDARAGTQRRLSVPGPSVCTRCGGTGRAASSSNTPATPRESALSARGVFVCEVCAGRGVARGGQSVDVRVPPGVRDGVKLRLRGVGGPGNPPGDVLVSVRVRLPAGARLLGNDVLVDVPVTPAEARRGTRLTVLGKRVEVPAGARDGQAVRVPGAGLAGGDMVVTLRTDTWQGAWRSLKDQVGGLFAERRRDGEDYA
jgi:molecular chaperone DnaJ